VACGVDTPTAPARPRPVPGVPAVIDLSAVPGVGTHGGSATLTARVMDALAGPVKDAVVTFTSDTGTLSAATATTDETGHAATQLTASPGAVKVTAAVGTLRSPDTLVVVQPLATPPTPTPTPPPTDPTDPGAAIALTLSNTGGTPAFPTTFTLGVRNAVTPFKVTWAFGDGAIVETASASATHQYTATGTFSASATVRDALGRSASATTSVAIGAIPPTPTPTPTPPTPLTVTVASSKTTLTAGQSATLTATVTGSATPATSYVWDCTGDGIVDATTSTNTTTCTYATAGVVTSYVSVTNGTSSGSGSVTLTIDPAPAPAYSVSLSAAPATVVVGSTSTLTATVTTQNGAPAPTSFAWDCDGNGTTDATTGTNTNVCTYATVGSVTPKVTATGGTVSGSATTTVTVTAVPPPVVSVNCAQVGATLTAHCVVSATLNGTAVPSGSITSVTWDFGDASSATTATNSTDHTYGGPSPYQVLVSNVTVTGSAAKGSGSTSVTIK
jgi:PKD repeat protein